MPGAVQQVAGHHIAGMQHGVAGLDLVPHLGRQARQVGAQVRVGEDEEAQGPEGTVGDVPILPR